jgi:hypothetical protein
MNSSLARRHTPRVSMAFRLLPSGRAQWGRGAQVLFFENAVSTLFGLVKHLARSAELRTTEETDREDHKSVKDDVRHDF